MVPRIAKMSPQSPFLFRRVSLLCFTSKLRCCLLLLAALQCCQRDLCRRRPTAPMFSYFPNLTFTFLIFSVPLWLLYSSCLFQALLFYALSPFSVVFPWNCLRSEAYRSRSVLALARHYSYGSLIPKPDSYPISYTVISSDNVILSCINFVLLFLPSIS